MLIPEIRNSEHEPEMIKVMHQYLNQHEFQQVVDYLMNIYNIDWTGEEFVDEQLPLAFTDLKHDVLVALIDLKVVAPC